MDSALEILGFLVGTSLGVFVLISLAVMLPARRVGKHDAPDVVWLGGPQHSEYGVSTSDLVLSDRRAPWAATPEVDWLGAARTAEPGGRAGGASAGW
ncbi:hypothetical protein ACFXJ8_21480 [Nonomuraea sp. NPDC059194]|uniref:hypothetical protein n=1 Tax=Nonomuraea sp. NPDC059194 TaxID=3346764 RepID=UPI0036773B81